MKPFDCPYCGFTFNAALLTNSTQIPELAPGLCESCLTICLIVYENGQLSAIRITDEQREAIIASPVYKLVIKPMIMLIKKQRAAIYN